MKICLNWPTRNTSWPSLRRVHAESMPSMKPWSVDWSGSIATGKTPARRRGSALERRLLQEYAEAHLVRKRPLEDMSLDLRKRLEVSYASMCTNPSPEWAADRRLFGVYLALLDLE